VSEAEALDAIATLADLTTDGRPVFIDVRGTPPGTPPAKALSEHARTSLTAREVDRNIRRSWPTREDVAQSYAAARGRISTTELGDLVGAQATNVGSVLSSLEDQGVLKPSREQRRGAGFHYLYVQS
jgi:ATP-dependent DNA helicase RecG